MAPQNLGGVAVTVEILRNSVHGPFCYLQPAPITGCIIMRGIALDIQHLRAIAYATPRPPPALVHYPRIEIATASAHHGHLFFYIRLSHLVKDPQHDGDAAAVSVDASGTCAKLMFAHA